MDVLFEFLALQHGLLVAAVVVDIALVALDPVVMHRVFFHKGQQKLPQIHIQRRLFIRLDPAFFLPAIDPALFQRVDHIFGIGVQLHLAGFFQR